MTMSKSTRATTSKDNIDIDDTDFHEPKAKRANASAGNRFASLLSEAEMVDYCQGPMVPKIVKSTKLAVHWMYMWLLY